MMSSAGGQRIGGRTYVMGGWADGAIQAAVEAYDPATDEWTREPDLPTPRMGLACAASAGAIYAVGGASLARPPHPGLATVERFVPDRS